MVLVGLLKVYLNLNVPGSPDVLPDLRMVDLEFICSFTFPCVRFLVFSILIMHG